MRISLAIAVVLAACTTSPELSADTAGLAAPPPPALCPASEQSQFGPGASTATGCSLFGNKVAYNLFTKYLADCIDDEGEPQCWDVTKTDGGCYKTCCCIVDDEAPAPVETGVSEPAP